MIKSPKRPLIGVSVLLGLLLIWFSGLLSLVVTDIQLDKVNCATSEDIKKIIKSDKIYVWELSEITDNIQSAKDYPCIESAKIILSFPRNLKIVISGRNPILTVKSYQPPQLIDFSDLESTPSSTSAKIDWSFPESSESSMVVDKFGVIFSPQQHYDIPLLFIDQENIEIGTKMEQQFINRLSSIIEKLKELNVFNNRYKKIRDYLLVEGPPKINISLSKDLSNQLASLQLILSKSKIDQREVDLIDLRYNKPVVTYVTKKKS